MRIERGSIRALRPRVGVVLIVGMAGPRNQVGRCASSAANRLSGRSKGLHGGAGFSWGTDRCGGRSAPSPTMAPSPRE